MSTDYSDPIFSSPKQSCPVPAGQISIQKRNGAIVGYSVYLGADSEGQKLRRFFKRLPDAEKFVNGRKTTLLPIGGSRGALEAIELIFTGNPLVPISKASQPRSCIVTVHLRRAPVPQAIKMAEIAQNRAEQ